jgi:epoxyqueuosine reductase
MNISADLAKKIIDSKASELGFIKVGYARYDLLDKEAETLNQWIELNYHADMQWMTRNIEKRRDVNLILPGTKSVICLAYNYLTAFDHKNNSPKISRYAWGRDYHKVLKEKLAIICSEIKNMGYKAVYYTDDGPVFDKAWAKRAGIGWMGKHTNIINPDIGSWIFLSEIFTDFEFEHYNDPVDDLCGNCSLCISACPTGAIVEEYLLDSRLCISYHTIENRGEIPENIDLHGWVFGCDVCQEVCPYNSPSRNIYNTDPEFQPLKVAGKSLNEITLDELNEISESEFTKLFSESPLKRAKYAGFRRNLSKYISESNQGGKTC